VWQLEGGLSDWSVCIGEGPGSSNYLEDSSISFNRSLFSSP